MDAIEVIEIARRYVGTQIGDLARSWLALVADIERLNRLVLGLAERTAGQSELLSRRAEK